MTLIAVLLFSLMVGLGGLSFLTQNAKNAAEADRLVTALETQKDAFHRAERSRKAEAEAREIGEEKVREMEAKLAVARSERPEETVECPEHCVIPSSR